MTLSLPTLSKLMKQLGFTPQRLVRRAYEQDATLVQRWHQEDFPRFHAPAKALGAVIMFASEVSRRTDYQAGTTWAPRGCTPVVRATGQRVSVNMISAISTTGTLHFMMVDGYGTAAVSMDFLHHLMLGATRPIVLVIDGHSIHKSGEVKAFIPSTEGILELCYVPSYSP